MEVIRIPYDRDKQCTVHDIEENKCLDQIKQLIGIEWAKVVVTRLRCRDPRRDFCLIVDEVGKLKEGWEERINLRASQFYAGYPIDPIVGDVVLCARQWSQLYGECDLAGLEENELEQILIKCQIA